MLRHFDRKISCLDWIKVRIYVNNCGITKFVPVFEFTGIFRLLLIFSHFFTDPSFVGSPSPRISVEGESGTVNNGIFLCTGYNGL